MIDAYFLLIVEKKKYITLRVEIPHKQDNKVILDVFRLVLLYKVKNISKLHFR